MRSINVSYSVIIYILCYFNSRKLRFILTWLNTSVTPKPISPKRLKNEWGLISAIMKNKQIETHFHISHGKEDEDFTVALDLNVKINLIQFLIAYIKANKKYNLNQQKEKKYA